MSNRGEFRSWFNAIADDPDFQRLPGDAFKLLFVLKTHLGAAGIGIVRGLVLQEQLQCTAEDLYRWFSILEAPKGGKDLGWIVREGNIAWVVNGLKFETSMVPGNWKHRKAIEKQLAPLGERPVVAAFRARYQEWFALSCELPEGFVRPVANCSVQHEQKPTSRTNTASIDSPLNGSGMGIDRVSDNKKQKTEDGIQDTKTSSSANAHDRSETIRSLITAMNKGMAENPELHHPSPVVLTHGNSVQAAADILNAGVPADFARSAIHERARAYRPSGRSRQINTLAYLAPAVIDAWEKQQANSEASSARRPAEPLRRTSRARVKTAPTYTPTTEDVKWQ